MNELLRLANEVSNKFPELSDKINELLEICYEEIDYGAAELYEVEACYDSIKVLAKTHK